MAYNELYRRKRARQFGLSYPSLADHLFTIRLAHKCALAGYVAEAMYAWSRLSDKEVMDFFRNCATDPANLEKSVGQMACELGSTVPALHGGQATPFHRACELLVDLDEIAIVIAPKMLRRVRRVLAAFRKVGG